MLGTRGGEAKRTMVVRNGMARAGQKRSRSRTGPRGLTLACRRRCVLGAVAGALAGLATAASAADVVAPPVPAAALPAAPTPVFVRVGGTAVLTGGSVAARIAGVPVAGGGADVSDEPALYLEAGYALTRNIAASLSLGYPPTFTGTGTGTLAPFGKLYEATLGLPVAEVTYRVDPIWGLRPYAGLGIGYAIVFAERAGAILSPKLQGSPAFVIVGGIDYDLSAHWGVFVDVKKAFLTQDLTGLSRPVPGLPTVLPVSARVRTDPILVSTGVAYRF